MTTTEHRTDHDRVDTHSSHVGAALAPSDDHGAPDAQLDAVVAGPISRTGHTSSDIRSSHVGAAPVSPATKASLTPTSAASPGNSDSALDHPPADAHSEYVEGGPTSSATIARSTSNAGTSPRNLSSDNGHPPRDTHGPAAVVALNSAPDQTCPDAHTRDVEGGPTPPVASEHTPSRGTPPRGGLSDDGHTEFDGQISPAVVAPSPALDQVPFEAHIAHVEGGPICPPAATARSSPIQRTPLVDTHLSMLAELLNDLEDLRKANVNRLEVMTRVGFDADGKERGFGMSKTNPAVLQVTKLVAELAKVEDHAEANLKKTLENSPLGPWVVAQRGLGLKTIARLLGATGDPYWNHLHGRPRTVSELRSYCGYGDAKKQLRRKGEKTNWSPTAKMRLHNIVEPIKKMIKAPCYSEKDEKGAYLRGVHIEDECTCSPYRVLWDAARAKYAGSLHPESCVRCGPAGHPALAGSPRSAAHQQALADRLVKKVILRDLWREAKRLHEHPGDQSTTDAQGSSVAGGPTSTE